MIGIVRVTKRKRKKKTKKKSRCKESSKLESKDKEEEEEEEDKGKEKGKEKEKEKEKEQELVNKTAPQTMRDMIMSQKALGSWQLNAVGSLSLDQIKKYLSSLSVTVSDDVQNIWMTAVVIALLTTQYKDQQVNWNLVVDKARKWIKKEEKRLGISIEWENSAIKFLQASGLPV